MPLFLEPSHPLLSTKIDAVRPEAICSEEIQSIIREMFAVARGERTDQEKRVMVGLAAPQIGINKRIILVDVNVDKDRCNLGELRAFINPEIIWYSDEKEEGREGCYSVDPCLWAIVPRASQIKVRAWNPQGDFLQESFCDFTARIFQHEIDHLNGIRFPERIGQKGCLQWVKSEQFPEYRNNWKNWPVHCPWEVWVAMREGQSYDFAP